MDVPVDEENEGGVEMLTHAGFARIGPVRADAAADPDAEKAFLGVSRSWLIFLLNIDPIAWTCTGLVLGGATDVHPCIRGLRRLAFYLAGVGAVAVVVAANAMARHAPRGGDTVDFLFPALFTWGFAAWLPPTFFVMIFVVVGDLLFVRVFCRVARDMALASGSAGSIPGIRRTWSLYRWSNLFRHACVAVLMILVADRNSPNLIVSFIAGMGVVLGSILAYVAFERVRGVSRGMSDMCASFRGERSLRRFDIIMKEGDAPRDGTAANRVADRDDADTPHGPDSDASENDPDDSAARPDG